MTQTGAEVWEQHNRLNDALGSKYQILCRLGGGGMAQVYLARHRMHGGLFAVKVLVDHLAQDPLIVARFEQEARMAATLGAHPNIVPIFDIGSGNGLYYMIMQYIPGEDLAGYLRRNGRLDLADAANVVAQAAEALCCAESRRIVHRDLKPANMLLDESGRIKLLDFGISRIADLANGLTRPGESIGTPHYMSPEQIRGESCDIRSDLYSLGVVFFELLTGRRPFENESATAIQIAHLSSPAPSLLSVDAALPAGCDEMVQKLLAKRPEDRYPDAAALIRDLTEHGALTGPGALRPQLNPIIQEAIAQAEAVPFNDTIRTTVADTPTPRDTATVLSMTPAPGPSLPPAKPDQSPSTNKSSRTTWIAVVSALAVILVAAAVYVAMHATGTPKAGPASAPSAASPTPPQVISDSHGRMLLVGAGPFLFGEKGTAEAKTMDLPAFYIDETEVSNAEYRRFCEATGHAAPQTKDYATHPDYPVSQISYEDAQAYAAWAGKRLPTEVEWEKAARGTDERTFPWGDAAWTSDVPKQLQPVNAQDSRRSPYGAYNMAGNVWEWTDSSYTPQPSNIAWMRRQVGGANFSSIWKVIKGGSFSAGGSDNFGIGKRRGLPEDGRSPWIGFRCARDAPMATR